MTETAGWGIPSWLPPQARRNLIQVDHDDRQAARDEDTELAQRREEAANRALALGIANARARGEDLALMELATLRLPADDEERAERTRDAIQYVIDTQREQDQRERAWEKDHPAPPAGPPEKLHVFFDEPRLPAPTARSATGRAIATRARRFVDVLEARRKLAAAEAAAQASKNDFGFMCERRGRSRDDDDGVVVVSASRRRGGPVARDDGLRFR
jgi:hypothetical protein